MERAPGTAPFPGQGRITLPGGPHRGSQGLPRTALEAGIEAYVLSADAGLAKSPGEARRLIQQGGAYVNNEPVTALDRRVTAADLRDGAVLLRAGKKKCCAVRPA